MKFVSRVFVSVIGVVLGIAGCSSKPKTNVQCVPGVDGEGSGAGGEDGTCSCEAVTTTQDTPCAAPANGICCADTTYPSTAGSICQCSPRWTTVMCHSEGPDYCDCGSADYEAKLGLQSDNVDKCLPSTGTICCSYPNAGTTDATCVCVATGDGTCGPTGKMVDECDASATPACPSGKVQVSDCRNIPPPGGGGGGGGGGSHCKGSGESCSSSGECCGHCELSDPNSSSYHECS